MSYSNQVLDHYENPRNVGSFEKGDDTVGTGMVGAPACGDVMKLQIKVNEQGVIEDAKFKTYGCGSAIASSSLATQTGAILAAMARSQTCWIIGLPAMSASGFPGSRLAAMRAGMMMTGDKVELMMRQFIT